MRTLELLKAFSPSELKELDKIVSENKRQTLAPLFRELKKLIQASSEPDNAVLFKKVFAKTYNKKQDYLLRNELRLLNEILYKYLAEQTALAHLHKYKNTFNFWLCNAYYERNMHSLLRSDIDDFIKEAIEGKAVNETMNVGESSAMLSLRSLWMIETQPKLISNINEQIQAVRDWKMEEKKRFLIRLREIEAREAYLLKETKNVTGGLDDLPDDFRTPPQTMVDLSDVDDHSPLLHYALLKKHAYQSQGQVRIEVLKDTLELVSRPDWITVLNIKARLNTLNQLGLDHIVSQQYAEADKYYEMALTETEQHKRPISPSTVHNYLTNQLNLHNYEKGIKIYERYRGLIDANRLKYPSRLFTSYCYLYTGQEDMAMKLLPKETDLNILLQIISRFVYPISFMMRGEYALAVSDLKNLKRMIKSIKAGDFGKQIEMTDAFIRYATAYTKSDPERKQLLDSIKQDIRKEQAKWQHWAAFDVQLHWLMDKLKE